jgi:hypothetical protein
MKWKTCFALWLAALLSGCENQAPEQAQTDFKNLQARCEALKGQNDTLKKSLEDTTNALDSLKADKEAMDRKWYGIEADRQSLKQQLASSNMTIEQLQKELASNNPAGTSASFVAPQAAPMAPQPATVAPGTGADDATIAALEATLADLDARIKAIQPGLGQARSKIMALARATVDVQMAAPPGGKIENGQVYRRDYDSSGRPMVDYSRRPVYSSLGPAVKKGDYSSQREKEEAFRKAKEEALPLEIELRSLQEQQAAAKAKLTKIRTPAKPGF